jgi:superfamily II DNA or RNA helicase
MINRAKIIRDAKNKKQAFIKIMKKIGDPKYLLIFASEVQLPWVRDILLNAEKYLGIYNPSFKEITAYTPPNKKDRLKHLRDFKNGNVQIILSNKVLDEGLNIPEAQSCIVLASTGNPTQFIQRRGRILRPFDDPYKDGTRKTHAVIYDVLVKPELDAFENIEEKKLEKNMISRQLEKVRLMSDLARNKGDNENNDFINEFIHPFTSEYFK